MNGTKQARIRYCQRCTYWRNNATWPWPRCVHPYPGKNAFLDDDFMDGPTTNCTGGNWLHLPPEGPPEPGAWLKWNRARHRAHWITRFKQRQKPLVKKFCFQMSKAHSPRAATDILDALLFLTHWIPVEVAQEIVSELHLPPLGP